MVIRFSTNIISNENTLISWQSRPLTALDGVHFSASSGVVSIPAGQSQIFLRIPVLSTNASPVSFEVIINTVSNANVGQSVGRVDIPSSTSLVSLASLTSVKFKELSGGGNNESCAINMLNEVICWGSIYHTGIGLQVGLYPYGIESVPLPMERKVLSDVKQISSGGFFTCALTLQNKVFCWGVNWYGQLGNAIPTNTNSATPVEIMGLSDIQKISLGASHGCGLNSQGQVFCWGSNSSGQHGIGSITATPPTTVIPVAGLSGVKQLTSGGTHTCALTAQNKVVCWGSNSFGQIGNNSTTTALSPVEVIGLTNIKQISAGGSNTCAINNQDNVLCWGINRGGQLGIGKTSENSMVPVSVSNLSNAKEVIVFGDNTCVFTNLNKTFCWGENTNDGLAINVFADIVSPREVTFLNGAKRISALCYISDSDSVYCRGNSRYGKLGVNAKTTSWAPIKNPDIQSYKQISTGVRHACALDSQNRVYCWGYNNEGQLGNNTKVTSKTPVLVSNLTSAKYVGVGGSSGACAITAQDTAVCWGHNGNGQLGNGTTTSSSVPVTVSGLTGVSQIAVGATHTCALNTQGVVYCWGSNLSGQVGNNSTANATKPVILTSLSGAQQIVAGINHTCALKTDGLVYCWGKYMDMTYRSPSGGAVIPTLIDSLRSVKEIAAGDGHACALNNSGNVYCWGDNSWEQSGKERPDGLSSSFMTPNQLTSLSDIKHITLGSWHSCAITNQETVLCWGKNTVGQLGNIIDANSAVPRQIFQAPKVSKAVANGLATYLFAQETNEVYSVGVQFTINSDPLEILKVAW